MQEQPPNSLRSLSPRRPGASGRIDAQCGFSLLEVLVAFVILALVATAIFRLFSGALGNASASDDYSRAVLVAQSALEEAGAVTIKEGTRSGEVDGGRFRWNVAIVPYDPPGVDADTERISGVLAIRLYRLTATSTFLGTNGRERTIALSTLRLGARDPQQ